MDNETAFKELETIIFNKLKLDCKEYNQSYIRRRVNARIISNNLTQDNYISYINLLKSNQDEMRELYDALTVNVTQFFRDITVWDVLAKDVIPKIVEEKKGKMDNSLNIWSCGCSSGEEPYSLAILLKEFCVKKGINPKITATDIDNLSLAKAKNGLYNIEALKTAPKEYILKYFRKKNVGDMVKYEIDPSLKPMINFLNHNFMSEMPPRRNFDMVLCRNVIIYFTNTAKDKLMETFYDVLVENGWLILGKSEVLFTIKSKHNFYLYNNDERIYRKERRMLGNIVEKERRQKWWHGYEEKIED